MLRQYINETSTHLFMFDSIDEQVDTANEAKKSGRHEAFMNRMVGRINLQKERSWIGRSFSDFEDVVKAVKSTWEQGMTFYSEMIEELRHATIRQPVSIRRQSRWSEDTGDEMDLDRLRRGQPYWRQSFREHRPGPVSVTIIAQCGGSASYSANELLWRGIACIALTELLEAAGYRVELWAAGFAEGTHTRSGGRMYGEDQNVAWASCTKRGDEPINPTTLVNAVSGWYYRTVKFATHGITDNTSIPSTGCGSTRDIPKSVVDLITQDEQVILCQNVWSKEGAIEWAKEQLEKMFGTSQS